MEDKKQKYLSQHQYSIFQGKDGRWRTTLPDKTKKSGRRLLAKSILIDLENEIVKFYENVEREETEEQDSIKHRLSKDITLEELYPMWLNSRILETNSMSTVKRNDQEWRRYYQGTKIVQKPMCSLTVNELRDWAHKMIDDHQFNKREYYNMALIIKKCFEYISNERICNNTWAEVKINTKKFKKIIKQDNDTQIYFFDEKVKIIQHALKLYIERPWNIGNLTIPLLFATGMRIGEIVALKYEDITDNSIWIRRGEVNDFIFDESQSKFVYNGKKIEDHVKTDCGVRNIPLTTSAKQIIEMIRNASQHYNYYDNDFIFCPASKRMESNTIDKKLYNYCADIGIPKKSAHKIRKTYISEIINGGIDLDTVCKVSGHVDLKTTLQSYYFCLERKEDVYDKFDAMFDDLMKQ